MKVLASKDSSLFVRIAFAVVAESRVHLHDGACVNVEIFDLQDWLVATQKIVL
jgi:hypothetical protein